MRYCEYIINLICSCLLIVVLFFFISCRKTLKVPGPIDQITINNVFANDETATAAVTGIYSQMQPTLLFFSCGGTTIYAGLLSDEMYKSNTNDNEEMEFERNELKATNNIVFQGFWLRAYQHIYQANVCIERLENVNGLSAAIKKQLLGEALFVRAFLYFYLSSCFGDVPLLTISAYEKNAIEGRRSYQEVIHQVVEDLERAKELLNESYPSTGRVRPNKWAARALLARVYLYEERWEEAEAEASLVIQSGQYTLLDDPANVFLANSNEAIWQLMPVEQGFNVTEARYLLPTTAATTRPNYPITIQLNNAFEPNDKRYANWITSKTVSGTTFYYPSKYKIRNIGLPVTEYYTVLRLAEQLLIRAEARAHQNKIDAAAADLNNIRGRAGLSLTTANDKASLLSAIEQERRVELFAEWGHRWFDLKRTGRATQVLSTIKVGWQETDLLFPIPLSEILKNPALKQNPGY
jgi:hypothetical protein